MSRLRIPDPRTLWERHVAAVLRVLSLALEMLRAEGDLPPAEKRLNRRLCFLARNAYHGLPASVRPQVFALQPNAEQWPDARDDLDAEWVEKRPDFKWRMHNDLATTPEELTMDFDIEAKRLGRPTSPNWVLTEQYVVSGVVRFLSAGHRYGNGVNAGAMVGYLQDSEPRDIVREVNRYIAGDKEHSIPDLTFVVWYLSDQDLPHVMTTDQKLRRTQVSPSAFTLHHLWVDLRSS